MLGILWADVDLMVFFILAKYGPQISNTLLMTSVLVGIEVDTGDVHYRLHDCALWTDIGQQLQLSYTSRTKAREFVFGVPFARHDTMTVASPTLFYRRSLGNAAWFLFVDNAWRVKIAGDIPLTDITQSSLQCPDTARA